MNLARSTLPPHRRSNAALVTMDVTKWFGETSGGVRTYLLHKQCYVERHTALRHVLVIPGACDAMTDGDGTRTYRLRGPHIPMRKPYRFFLTTRSLPRIVRHERPDVIEVGSPFLVPWLARFAARPLDVPLVTFFHSNFPRLLGRSWVGPAAEECAWWYMRRLDAIFQCTIVASDFAGRELARAGIERTVRIPLGVDLVHFHPERPKQRETALRLGVPPGPFALYAGRLAPEKELDVLVDAWPRVYRATGVPLVVAGDGPLRTELRQRVRNGYGVTMLPFQTDRNVLADLLAAATVYVSPGSLETFGLSALEALASGTPVLSSHRGGVAELVERSGGGALFESGDAGGLADAATSLLRGAPATLGAAGRRYAEREHAWDVVFDRLFALYGDVARGRFAA